MSSLIIAAAGAGKTTFLVKKALEISENVLITTYTDANEQSIRDKFYEINGCIPSNSVAFVYKTKRLPSNDIGTKWTPDVLE